MDANPERSLPLGRIFLQEDSLSLLPPLSSMFEYAVVPPEQTSGHLGIGTTVEFSSFLG